MCIKGHKHESCLATKNNTIKEKNGHLVIIYIYILLKDEESKTLFEIKIPSQYGSITLLIKNIRGLKELSNVSKHKFKSSYKDVIYHLYKENWGKQMLKHSEGKLCSYSIFKTNFGLEKYLCILKSFEQRRNFTRFRISSHRLQIERGRYQGALRQYRLCLRCTLIW